MMMVSFDRLKKDGKTKNVKLLGKCILTLVDHLFWNLPSAVSSNPMLFVRKPA